MKLIFCIWHKGLISLFCRWLFCCFSYHLLKRLYFPALYGLGTLGKNQLTTDQWVYFWTLNRVPLIYMPIRTPVTHCLDYGNFAVNFQVGKCESYCFVLFRDCFLTTLGSLKFHMNFRIGLSIFKRHCIECVDKL